MEKGITQIPYGFNIDKKRSNNHIKLDNIMISDDYAQTLAELLPKIDTKFTLNLSNNRLTQWGADHILEKIDYGIQKLNISNNPNVKFIDLEKFVLDEKICLKDLNIEGNSVGDNFVIKLALAIEERPMLQSLNIAKNYITNKGAIAVSNLIKDDTIPLSSLFLKWNYIKAKGAAAICDAIKVNTKLKTLEMSFNPIGEENNRKIHQNRLSSTDLRFDSNMISGINQRSKQPRV